MNRPIKFRLYSKPAKKYVDYITIGFSKSGELRMYSTEIGVGPVLEDNYIVEQFTGLTDKNGEDIFEGDVLMDDSGIPVEYWVVAFEDGKFVGEIEGVSEDIFELTELEVVGNIHENKELWGPDSRNPKGGREEY